MKKYIHIGYPKNLSTTLQRDLFPNHSQIYHLGVGIGSNIDYINDQINVACEDYLIYATNRMYSQVKSKIRDAFHQQFDMASSTYKKAAGISAELLSFKFTPDHVDTEIKASRLFDLFGNNTKILIIIRNQKDLLKSLYRESIKIGYPNTYREFIEYIYCFKDRSYALDFCYDQTIALYGNLFGIENIEVIQQEQIRDQTSGKLLYSDTSSLLEEMICQSLGLIPENLNLGIYNDPLPDRLLAALREINKSEPHSLGKSIYNITNGHRLVKYFKEDLKFPMQEALNQDVLKKQEKIARCRNVSPSQFTQSIDFYSDPLITERLFNIYRESNENLKKYVPNLSPKYDF